jgi:ParB-like chromosome segregation protein Spo0J
MSNYIVSMDVSRIKENPINAEIYSFNQKEHSELVKSIELNGLLEPLTITNNNQLVSGHRRFNAIKEIGYEKVECRLSEFDNLNVALIELNRYRKKLPTEILKESEVLKSEYSKIVKRGRPQKNENKKGKNWTILNVSSTLGVSTTQLKKLISIKKYEPTLLDKIDLGVISVGKAYAIVRNKHILNGNGGRPPKTFKGELLELLEKYSVSKSEVMEVLKIYKK